MYFFKLRQYRNLLGSSANDNHSSEDDKDSPVAENNSEQDNETSLDVDPSSEFSETESKVKHSSQVVSLAQQELPCSKLQFRQSRA